MKNRIKQDKSIALPKYQIFLTPPLQERLNKYFTEQYLSNDKVYSATFRKALDEFLEKRGY